MIFDRYGSLRWFAPLAWALYPLAYSGYTVIRAQFMPMGTGMTSRYPYFFMDADTLGWSTALLNMAGIALGFVLFGMVAVAIDKWLARRAVARRNLQ